MSQHTRSPALDHFRLLAALLVICNHTSPLDSLSPEADFWLTRVLARVAVPFFFMVSGYFLARKNWAHTGRFLKRTALIYAAADPLTERAAGTPGPRALRRVSAGFAAARRFRASGSCSG